MLEKIITIKNVAKFRDYDLLGKDIRFQKYTVVYGDNGKGKTSLAGIFRSLSKGDTAFVLSKKTIGATEEPYIKIKHSNGITEFKKGAWDNKNKPPVITVFDSNYVNENVFSGNRVEHNHKKNLAYLVIGEDNVELASQIEDLNSKAKDSTKEINEVKKWIQDSIKGSLSFEEFLSLEKDEEIDSKIEKQQELIASVKQADVIAKKQSLKKISLPALERLSIEKLLQLTLDDISKDVEEKVRLHVEYLGENGESWVENGFHYHSQNNETCPFCGHKTDDSILLKLYSQYFSIEYKNLKKKIADTRDDFQQAWQLNKLLEIQSVIGENNTLFQFWESHLSTEKFDFDTEFLNTVWNSILADGNSMLENKGQSLLEAQPITETFHSAFEKLSMVQGIVTQYNAWVDKINGLIVSKKSSIAKTSIAEEQKNLDRFANIKIRFSVPENEWCSKYTLLLKSEDETKKKVAQMRKDLKKQSESVIDKYQKDINRLLKNFGTDFSIVESKPTFQGKSPSVTYSLSINGESIPLGTDEDNDKPAFKTTLSEGEKSALAFAFFIAQLNNDVNLKDKVVVIDDPVTSLDEDRKICTKQEILKVAQIAQQVIILSHDRYFLKSVKEDLDNANSLCIKRDGENSRIDLWDIELDTMNSYHRDFHKMKNFSEKGVGDTKDVARCVRPVLEYYLRMRFPEEFETTEWLGNFIEKIRNADSKSRLVKFKGSLDELSDINEFSKKYHHNDPNSETNLQKLNDSMLRPWVNRTIEFIRNT